MATSLDERPVAARAAYSARPTLRVDGQRLPLVDELLRTCTLFEAEGGLSSLALGLGNWGVTGGSVGLAFDAGGPIALGTRLQVYAGDTTAPREVFDGVVHAIEASASVGAPPSLLLLAEDKLFAARMARRTAIYDNMNLNDVLQAVCGRHGLTLDASGLPDASALWAQFAESDLAFLRRVLGRADCDLQVVGGQLQVRPSADMDRGSIDLTLYSQLREVRVIADLSEQATAVTASGFDAKAGNSYSVSSGGAQPGAGTGASGASLLAAIFNRSEHLGALPCLNEREARALADAAFDQRARRFVRVHGSTEGNAELRVGARVTLHGVGRRFDNTYAVVEARHRYDQAGGYVTEFVAQSACLAEA
jgi:phage protein D